MEPKKLSLSVGENLKTEIKASEHKTQEQFALAFGADVRTVNRWINEGMRDIDVIESVAEFLGIDVFTLIRY
jgi:transcriptional regulator with XRE-family HTH domain